MSDELIVTQVVATQEAVVKPEEVNVSPKVSPELQAEITRLEAKKAELEKTAKEAEEKAIYWRKQKAESRAEYFKGDRREEKPPAPEVQPEVGIPPKKEDFDDYDKYVEALADYRADVKLAKWQRDETNRKTQADIQIRTKGMIDAGFQKYPDFEDVARDPSVPITVQLVDVMTQVCEHPEDIAYYLGKNRMEAIRLSRMDPIAVAKEIIRIEMEIAKNPPINNPNPNQNIISNAPPPIKPVGASESINKPVEQMTQREYEAWAKQRGMKPY